MRIGATDFQNSFGKYLKIAMDGNDVIITKNGNGVAKLIKYEDPMISVMKEGSNEYYIRKRVSYSEFLEITEKTEQRYELIDGELYLMASPNHKHQVLTGEIFVRLYSGLASKPCRPLTAPYDVKLHNESEKFEDDPNVVQPDLLVVCDEEKVDGDGRYQGVPALVIEILSRNTKSKDMVKKLDLYMRSGVLEYWIVDPEEEKMLVYTFSERHVDTVKEYSCGDVLSSKNFSDLQIEVEELFAEL